MNQFLLRVTALLFLAPWATPRSAAQGAPSDADSASPLGLCALVSDGMVLQRDHIVPVWGTGRPGAAVVVTPSWSGESTRAFVEGDGHWRLTLRTPGAGGPFQLRFEMEGQVLVVDDVLSGEVWLASGQSNMEWKIAAIAAAIPDYDEIRARIHQETLRFFDVPNRISMVPESSLEGAWRAITPQSWPEVSAVAYYFANELHATLGVPIGILSAEWGGTVAESWTSETTLRSEFPEFEATLAAMAAAHATQDGQGARLQFHQNMPTALFNGMIAPLAGYGLRGVIWYQGESNRGRAAQYERLFPALIRDWRRVFSQGDLPFLFVQIAPYRYGEDTGQAAGLRDAQRKALALPATGMACTMDIGNPDNIHPKNKWEVGRRLALWARALCYGEEDLDVSGPLYRSHSAEGSGLRVAFDHAQEGLVARGGAPTHFTIAGADRVFHPATATIDGATVLVQSPAVPEPVAVRFAWGAADLPNLFDAHGLPASSFRTDDWNE